jgi:FdhE protein
MNLTAGQDAIRRAVALARKQKPAYGDLYPFLEALFLIQASAREHLELSPYPIAPQMVQTKWEGGFPLIRRWDFPVDSKTAESILAQMLHHLPESNESMKKAHGAISRALSKGSPEKGDTWHRFLTLEPDGWEEMADLGGEELPSFLFLGRSCIRPSLEWTSADLLSRFPLPDSWHQGYCPVCGSLPSLLYSVGEGERWASCSWCATKWNLHRFQCPSCGNRYHESLGYLLLEAEKHYRIQYCNLCKAYYKLVDTREMLDPPYFPLEEWTTLHLDLLAQKEGWLQPPSASDTVYGEEPIE